MYILEYSVIHGVVTEMLAAAIHPSAQRSHGCLVLPMILEAVVRWDIDIVC